MKPSILIVFNGKWTSQDLTAFEQILNLCGDYLPQYAFTARYAQQDLSKSVIDINTPVGMRGVISADKTKEVIQLFNKGETLNVMVYDGMVHLGKTTPAGGCEWQNDNLATAPISAYASVMYNGSAFAESCARSVFHELIHELFDLQDAPDTLHDYLVSHGGYEQNILVDLRAVFKDVNSPQGFLGLMKSFLAFLMRLFKKPEPIIPIDEHIPPPVPPVIPVSKIQIWAKAIEKMEGYFVGSRSYKNNNPGNIKFTKYSQSLGATAYDKDNFCIFPTYDAGFKALCRFLIDACENRLTPYINKTLAEFTQIYALPPAGSKYAENVATAIGCKTTDLIKILL